MGVMINKYDLPMIIFSNTRWGEDLFPLFYGYKKSPSFSRTKSLIKEIKK